MSRVTATCPQEKLAVFHRFSGTAGVYVAVYLCSKVI